MIWVYTGVHEYLIAKRNPFSYYLHTMDSQGIKQVEIESGTAIALPIWDWVRKTDTQTFAGWSGRVYEISDLMIPQEKIDG